MTSAAPARSTFCAPPAGSASLADHPLLDAVIDLGRLSLTFGLVPRGTFHADGVTPESDTTHTTMLGLIGCALAPLVRADLDVGRVAQFALVHDLVEAYAGDTRTLRQPDAAARAAKMARERAAQVRIQGEFAYRLPWLPQLIAEYEAQDTAEARYVRALDKLLPKIAHLLNGLVSVASEQMSIAELAARYQTQADEIAAYAGDFPVLLELRAALVDRLLQHASAIGVPAGETDALRSRSR